MSAPKNREELIALIHGCAFDPELMLLKLEAHGVRLVPAEPTDLMCIYADGGCMGDTPEHIAEQRPAIAAAIFASPYSTEYPDILAAHLNIASKEAIDK